MHGLHSVHTHSTSVESKDSIHTHLSCDCRPQGLNAGCQAWQQVSFLSSLNHPFGLHWPLSAGVTVARLLMLSYLCLPVNLAPVSGCAPPVCFLFGIPPGACLSLGKGNKFKKALFCCWPMLCRHSCGCFIVSLKVVVKHPDQAFSSRYSQAWLLEMEKQLQRTFSFSAENEWTCFTGLKNPFLTQFCLVCLTAWVL